MKLNKLGIPYYGKKLKKSIVHSNGATYNKLHVPIVPIVICSYVSKRKFKMTEHISKLIQNFSVLIYII